MRKKELTGRVSGAVWVRMPFIRGSGWKMKRLSELRENAAFEIKWLRGNFRFADLLSTAGLGAGTEGTVMNSFFGNVVVNIGGRRIALDKDTASHLLV